MSGIIRNLLAGDYSPVERGKRILRNVARRRPNRGCCGNYGEPGC